MKKLKEFAAKITGKEYGFPQFTKEEIRMAKENDIVIIHGYSDGFNRFLYTIIKIFFRKQGIKKLMFFLKL